MLCGGVLRCQPHKISHRVRFCKLDLVMTLHKYVCNNIINWKPIHQISSEPMAATTKRHAWVTNQFVMFWWLPILLLKGQHTDLYKCFECKKSRQNKSSVVFDMQRHPSKKNILEGYRKWKQVLMPVELLWVFITLEVLCFAHRQYLLVGNCRDAKHKVL